MSVNTVAAPAQHVQRRHVLVALVVYVALTAILGRDVLRHPATTVLHNAGDPLVIAAILHWTTTHVPFSHAWWQFPVYYPTPDVLAFSEHLLGVGIVSAPIEWISGNVLVAYNVTALLTYPLCALAMYALVWRLARSVPAAFLAGLAYAFAPYRLSQLPHVQMLALFWAPLALTGLHAYVETTRARWLILYGAAWLMQGLSNSYFIVFFSLFAGLWVLWFVVGQRDWRGLWRIAVTTIVAAIPLVPVLIAYVSARARNGFVHSLEEVHLYSADVTSVFCASPLLTFWSWLRVTCTTPETELFPGAALAVLCAIGIAGVSRRPRGDAGTLRSTLVFYLAMATVTWLCALGPDVQVMGENTGVPGPFALLARVPGLGSLRVPARFWGLTVLSLCVVAGIVTARLLNGRTRMVRIVTAGAIAVALLTDGWVNALPSASAGTPLFPPSTLAGRVVMVLPVGDEFDIPATYGAVVGDWRTVNGYSTYHPSYYAALNYSVRFEEDGAFLPFQALTGLDVLVQARAPRLIAMVERQPGVEMLVASGDWLHYRLPRRGRADAGRTAGTRIDIVGAHTSCAAATVQLALDGDPQTRWVCGPGVDEQAVEIDLGRPVTAGAVVHGIGRYHDQFPHELIVETSTDRETWQPAWKGSVLAQTIKGGIEGPDALRIVIPFAPRPARYIRLRRPSGREYSWTIADLEVWSGNTGVP